MKIFNGKRLLAFVLAASMIFSLLPGHAHATVSVDGNTVNMKVGDTHVITINGDHSALNETGNETVSIAAAFAPQMADRIKAEPATEIVSGHKYVLFNQRLQKSLEVTTVTVESNQQLYCRETLANGYAWTITAVEGEQNMYTVKTADGKYLTIGGNIGNIVDDSQNIRITKIDGTNTWQLFQNDNYLCDFTNNKEGEGIAAGYWGNPDGGNPWYLYEITASPAYSWSLANNGEAVTAINAGKQYIFEQHKDSMLLLANVCSDKGGGGNGSGSFLKLKGTKADISALNVWNVTATDTADLYHVTDEYGMHLNVKNGMVRMGSDETTIKISKGSTTYPDYFQIGQPVDGSDTVWYLNRWGGSYADSTAVGGWSDVNDQWSQWNVYEVTATALGTTTVTFTALKAGTTELTVDGTTYSFNVTGSHEHSYGTPTFNWSGTESATATFVCSEDETHVETVDATITSNVTSGDCETGATVVYTATVTMGGTTYTDTKTETTEGGGHSYVNGFCTACDDYESATLVDGVYQIANAGQLYWFADLVNKSGDATVINAVLTDDIVVNQAPLSETSRPWNPIGYYKTTTNKVYYSGTFDGQGHTVSGLYYYSKSTDYVGMFGRVDESGTVKNLGVVDSEFTGRNNVGGIAGSNYYGTVSGCWNTSKITGNNHAGGVVGNNSGTISQCYNSGTVISTGTTNTYVGGVVGSGNEGSITDCFNSGNVTGKNYVGGIVGRITNAATVENCYNSGNVTPGSNASGPVIGWNYEPSADKANTIDNCYYLADSETDTLDGTTAMTEAQFASGEVTWLLNDGRTGEDIVWKQTLSGADASETPKFTGLEVYQNEGGDTPFVNETVEHTHSFVEKVATQNFLATEATCEKAATYYFSCQCGEGQETDTFESGEALGHTYGAPDFTWTGVEAKATFTCQTDNSHTKIVDASITSETTGGDCTTGATVVCTATVTFGEQTYTDTKTVTGEAGSHIYANGFCSVCDAYEPAVLVDGVYQISNGGQLYWFAKLVNDGETDADAILMENITVNENVLVDGELVSDTSALRAWTPIGGNGTSTTVTGVKYAGTFDGNGKTVSGLYFSNANAYFAGLIGYMNGGEVKNVGVIDSYFAARQYFAGVVGKAESSTVLSCYNTGYIKAGNYSSSKYSQYFAGVVGQANGGTVISNCYNAGTIQLRSYSKNAGGVVGNLTSAKDATVRTKIIDSYNTGDFTYITNTGNVSNIGGVAGSTTYSDVERCWNEGAVKSPTAASGGGTGGVVGKDSGSSNIINCYNEGSVDCPQGNVGGIVGAPNDKGRIENCYNIGTVTSELTVNAGGIVGNVYYDSFGFIVNCYYLTGSCTGVNGVLTGSANSTVDQAGLTGKTAEQFASGEVTYLLNDSKSVETVVWKQTLTGEDADAAPKFTGLIVYHDADADPAYFNLSESHEHVFDRQNADETYLATAATCEAPATYYLSCVCGEAHETDTFVSDEKLPHSFVNGFCSVCDAYEPAVLNGEVYEISNGGQLYWFAKLVTDGDTDAKAILMKDITVNEDVLVDGALNTDADAVAVFRPWIGIGDSGDNKFIGSFDGNNKSISGLYFNDTTSTTGRWFGLIPYMYEGGEVKNVAIADSYFNGNQSIGAVAGLTYKATVTNCHNLSVVNGTTSVGGVVGTNQYSLVVGCTNSGTVSGTGQVGGVVGNNTYTSGDFVATVKNCSNTGAVNGIADSASTDVYVGGVVGVSSSGIVENCTNSGKVTNAGRYTGGVIGESKNSTVTGCTNSGLVEGKSYTGGVIGKASGTVSDCHNTVDITGGGYLGGVIGYVTYVGSSSSTYAGSSITDCTNTGNVTGTGTYVGGVFGIAVGQSASTSKRTKIADCSNTGDVEGNQKVGGLVGEINYAEIDESFNTGAVASKLYEGAGTASGRYVGGLVGYVQKGSVIKKSYNTGDVAAADNYVGGLVGYCASSATIDLCYNNGDVSGKDWVGGFAGTDSTSSIKNSYTSGTVAASETAVNVGGMTGKATATYTNCYYLAESETDELAGTTAKTEAQFASGEVAYLLNGSKSDETVVWKQTLTGENADEAPVFEGETVYWGYDSCADDAQPGYSNNSATSETKPEHTDEAKDHECDVCGEDVGEHVAAEGSHDCEYCGKPASECVDEGKDHECDICGENVGEHVAAEGSHDCEYCGKPVSECVDEGKDHECDVCGENVGEHVAAEGGHDCEYCGKPASECVDEGKDHECDICGDEVGEHVAAEGSHDCEYCGKPASECVDEGMDHECDVCGENVGKHEAAEGSHDCEYCGKPASECVDEGKDHECDICGENVGKHEDTDKDHDCEYGCSETIGSCEDNDNDGKCDYGCGKEFEVEPEPTEPEPTEPKPTEPEPTEPKPTEPKPTEPEPTEPEATEPEAPKVEGVTRLAGADRLVTSYLVADQLKEKMGVEKFENIIVASGGTFADALPGSYLSAVKNAPILLTLAKDKYVNQTADYIKANLASGGTVYILGGESAVPASMEAALAGIKVQRVAGADRFGTNLAILKEAGVKAGDEILVCTAKEFADSLSASATGKPILLVYKKLTAEQKDYLATLSGCKFTVVGGTTAVPDSIAKEVEAYGAVTRLAGKDRLETSTMVAAKYFADAKTTVVAYGWNFPDGLCGGSLAYAMDAPLILAHSKEKLAQFTADYTTKAGLKVGYVLGGDGLVDDAATRAIFGMGSESITLIQ